MTVIKTRTNEEKIEDFRDWIGALFSAADDRLLHTGSPAAKAHAETIEEIMLKFEEEFPSSRYQDIIRGRKDGKGA